ncbi:MAG: PAS domain-containing protein [Anaerolineae bacterium]|nr:PAS domain-containing protein [Anaerolineae bacterium]
MAYWPVVPLALSVALLTAAYAARPRTTSHRLFAAFLCCTVLHAGALLLLSYTGAQASVRWLAGLRYVVAYPLPDLLVWLLVVDMIAQGEPPPWVHAITASSLLFHSVVAVIAAFDLSGRTTVLYRDLVLLPGQGYALSYSALHLIPQLVRLIPLGGTWGGLVMVLWRQDRQRQVFTGAGLLLAILLPLASHLAVARTERPFTGLTSVADLALALILGYVILRACFAPLLRAATQRTAKDTQGWVVLDSAGNILDVNPSAARILGIDGQAVRYASYTALFAARAIPPDLLEALSYAIAVHPAPYQTEIAMQSPAGPVYVQVQVAPIRDAAGLSIGKTLGLTETTALRMCQHQLSQARRAHETIEDALSNAWGPAVDLGDGVLVLALAGALEPARTARLVAGLLERVRTHHARVALLDLSAVSVLPEASATALLQGMEAAALLGTQIGWVGIQPAVADLLSDLALPIDPRATFPDLPTALAYCKSR